MDPISSWLDYFPTMLFHKQSENFELWEVTEILLLQFGCFLRWQ